MRSEWAATALAMSIGVAVVGCSLDVKSVRIDTVGNHD